MRENNLSANSVPIIETPVDEVTAEYRMREDNLPHVRSRVNVGSLESAALEFISANPVPFSETPVDEFTAAVVRPTYAYATPTTTAIAKWAPADASVTCVYTATPTLFVNGHDGFHADGHKNENCKLRNSAKVTQLLNQGDVRNGQVGN